MWIYSCDVWMQKGTLFNRLKTKYSTGKKGMSLCDCDNFKPHWASGTRCPLGWDIDHCKLLIAASFWTLLHVKLGTIRATEHHWNRSEKECWLVGHEATTLYQRAGEKPGFKSRGIQVWQIGLMAGDRVTGDTDCSDCGRADCGSCVANLGKYTP